jgi:hypothetical protein
MFDVKLHQIFALIKRSQQTHTKLLTWSSTRTKIQAITFIITIPFIANTTNVHEGVVHQIGSCFVTTGHRAHINPYGNIESCS